MKAGRIDTTTNHLVTGSGYAGMADMMDATYFASNGAEYQVKSAKCSALLYSKRIKSGLYKEEDGQLLKRCSRCKEHWPADTEFFYSVKKGDGLNEWCKACYQEWRYPNGRKIKPQSNQGAIVQQSDAPEGAFAL